MKYAENIIYIRKAAHYMKHTLKANKMLDNGSTLAKVTKNTCFTMPERPEEAPIWKMHHITPTEHLASVFMHWA